MSKEHYRVGLEELYNSIDRLVDEIASEQSRILSIIEEHAQRYSRGSVTRVALDNLALEIRERS